MRRFRKALWLTAALLALAEAAFLVYWYLIPSQKIIYPFGEHRDAYFVYADTIDAQGAVPLLVDGQVLLPFDTVKRFIDPNIWYDAKTGTVTVTTADHTIRMQSDSLNAMINDKPVTLNLPVSDGGDGVKYVPVTFLNDFYNINMSIVPFESSGTQVVIAGPASGTVTYARPTRENAVVRTGPSIRKPIVKKYTDPGASGVEMTVYAREKGWLRVRTADGAVGYIKQEHVSTEERELTGVQAPERKQPWKPAAGRIIMTWDLVSVANPDTSAIAEMPGLDVISPTWFEMSDPKGELINRAEKTYVDWAHARGYKVWPTLTNNFSKPDATHDFLSDSDAKDNLIRKILAFSALYELDGINIDFENINKSDRDAYTEFVREITPILHEQGLVVSVDVNVPEGSDNWSLCYDHRRLGEAADYVMLMAYDQHWSSGGEAGSVAEIEWVEANLRKVLELVPADRLVLGIPLYTRLWKDLGDGKAKYMGVLSMDNAQKRISEQQITPVWDEKAGQYYAEYVKDGEKYMFWLEDTVSINLRTSLALKYNLAGVSSWQRNDGGEGVWTVISSNLKTKTEYAQWSIENPNLH